MEVKPPKQELASGRGFQSWSAGGFWKGGLLSCSALCRISASLASRHASRTRWTSSRAASNSGVLRLTGVARSRVASSSPCAASCSPSIRARHVLQRWYTIARLGLPLSCFVLRLLRHSRSRHILRRPDLQCNTERFISFQSDVDLVAGVWHTFSITPFSGIKATLHLTDLPLDNLPSDHALRVIIRRNGPTLLGELLRLRPDLP
jgi:hypothetical protein